MIDVHGAVRMHRVRDSSHLSWPSMSAAVVREPPVTEPFHVAANDRAHVVMVTSGRYVIQSRRGSRWDHELYGPESIGVTPPGRTKTLRWESVSSEPMESLHVWLEPSLLIDTAAEIAPARDGLYPDSLRFGRPEVIAACVSVGWGLRHDAPALYADAAAQVLAAQLLGPGPDSDVRPPGLSATILTRVVAYLHEHLARDVTLDELSRVANLSKYHLLRQFAAAVGMPPLRYLTALRMEHASRMLRTTALPVQSVAAAVGYASASQFGTAFRRRFGETPGQYRDAGRR